MIKPVIVFHPWDVSYKKNTWRSSMKIMGRVLFSIPTQFLAEFWPPTWGLISVLFLLALSGILFVIRPFVILACGLCGYLSEPTSTSTPPDINKETMA